MHRPLQLILHNPASWRKAFRYSRPGTTVCLVLFVRAYKQLRNPAAEKLPPPVLNHRRRCRIFFSFFFRLRLFLPCSLDYRLDDITRQISATSQNRRYALSALGHTQPKHIILRNSGSPKLYHQEQN